MPSNPGCGLVEPLENRRLLSSGLTLRAIDSTFLPLVQATVDPPPAAAAVTSRGTLVIKGTDSAESIVVERRGGNYFISVSGFALTVIGGSGVKRVLVEANGGDDRVGIARALDTTPVTIAGGSGGDTITGSLGDTLIGGAGNDILYVPTLSGLDNLNLAADDTPPALLSGGAGDDKLVAGALDSVIGGTGQDTALYYIGSLSGSGPDGQIFGITIEPRSYSAASFASRASGVEVFNTLWGSLDARVRTGGA